MSLNENIKQYRIKNGLTQEQLAQKLGLKQYVIAKYENGSSNPSLDLAPKICEVLNITLDELYGIESSLSAESKPKRAKNSRAVQMQEIFDKLTPEVQRAILKQVKGLIK